MSNSENQQNATPSSDNVGYVERFEKERNDWTQQIKDLAARFKKVEDLVDVQVDLYSQRQVGVEYMHQLITLQSRLKKNLLAEWKKAFDALLFNEDYRYSDKERAKIADEKTSISKLKVEILQTHIEFFRETVKTIDNMIFGVKHRLEIEDFRRGNK